MKTACKAILFDLDGTLYDSSSVYREALRACGFDRESRAYLEARALVKRKLGIGHVCARNRILYFKALLESSGFYSPAAVLDKIHTYELKIAELCAEQWAALSREQLFQKLTARYPIAVVTNENLRTQMIKLRAIDPNALFFKVVVTSEELGVEKPNPLLFEEASLRLGIPLTDCLVVGDDYDTDIAPAVRLGAKAVLTREFRESELASAASGTVPVIQRLDELLEVLGL